MRSRKSLPHVDAEKRLMLGLLGSLAKWVLSVETRLDKIERAINTYGEEDELRRVCYEGGHRDR